MLRKPRKKSQTLYYSLYIYLFLYLLYYKNVIFCIRLLFFIKNIWFSQIKDSSLLLNFLVTDYMPKSHLDIKDLTMQKPYLSIGEVAAKFDVSTDLLRKWEREFPQYLRPRRNGGDCRLYDQRAVKQVAVIYRLIRVEGLSIDGTRRRLKECKKMTGDESRQEVIQKLQYLREKLMGMINELDVIAS